MCGVLLQFEKSKNIDLKKFKEALELMEYRGPDNQSIVFYDDLDKEPNAQILHITVWFAAVEVLLYVPKIAVLL